MKALLLLATLLASAPAAAAQDSASAKCFVTDGKTSGVFYGMSILMDLWGNFRRQVWTLRPDGVLLFGAPDGTFEDFVARPLTDKEKAETGRYSIDGAKFFMTYRDGGKGEGKIEYNPDKSIKRILAAGLQVFPVLTGLGTPLTGYWSNCFSFNNAALKMSTTVFSNYSFFEGGIFTNESGAGTIGTAIRERTQNSGGGIEVIREEVSRFYGGPSPSKMGKFEVKGSSLILSYDDGKREVKFLGQLSAVKPGESAMIFIGNGLYDGTFGVFAKKSGDAAPAPAAVPPAGLARCTSEHFDLAVPAAWRARLEDLDGTKAFFVTPAADPDGKFTLVLTGTGIDNKNTKATDPEMVASLEALVSGWVKSDKVAKDGGMEKVQIGGTEAVRLRFSLVRDGVAVKIEAACAVRDGHALVALTLASDAAMLQHGAAARELLATASFPAAPPAPKVELQHVKGDGFELDVPKAWTAKELEQNGTKTVMIVPPAGEAEYVIQLIPSEAGQHATAAAPGAVQELRDLVKQIAPALTPVGAMETFKAGGEPAAGVVYGGRNEKNEVVLVKAYLTLKAKKAVVVLVVGKETRDKEYGALLRQAIESLTLK